MNKYKSYVFTQFGFFEVFGPCVPYVGRSSQNTPKPGHLRPVVCHSTTIELSTQLAPVSFISTPVHQCTSILHQYTSAPVHQCTSAPVHQCTSAPVHHFTSAPVHQCTSAPVHQCTHAPVHQCTSAPVHQYTAVQKYKSTPVHICTTVRYSTSSSTGYHFLPISLRTRV